jgi:NRAMP (natural resistance-associated macrophage protein)-like metal ion transporter
MDFFRIFGANRARIVSTTTAPADAVVVSRDTPIEAFSPDLPVARPLPAPSRRKWWRRLGPGLVTGASDDDPSGIATYSQVGAQFGYGMGWTMLLTYPLMAAIQEISARLGCITHQGIAANIRRHYSRWMLRIVVGMLVAANVINLGADIGGMGAALKLLVGGSEHAHALVFGLLTVMLMVCLQYARYVAVLKWLCLSLFAYVATVLMVHVPWGAAMTGLLVPSIGLNTDYLTALVAVLGTTISPYLFFWQSQHEVEERRSRPGAKPLRVANGDAPRELRRIRLDTLIGMGFSNVIALCIIIATAATLNAHGVVNIETSAQAAEALRPIAGDFAFAVFAAGIVGTGMLAVPVLAGSAAYAVAEAFRWPNGLARGLREAKAFYGTIAVSTLIGVAMNFVGVDPVKALFWRAVINGLLAPPLMAVIMLLASNPKAMGRLVLPPSLRIGGWVATVVMGLAAVGMLVSWVV